MVGWRVYEQKFIVKWPGIVLPLDLSEARYHLRPLLDFSKSPDVIRHWTAADRPLQNRKECHEV
jgi:hypothetical protein